MMYQLQMKAGLNHFWCGCETRHPNSTTLHYDPSFTPNPLPSQVLKSPKQRTFEHASRQGSRKRTSLDISRSDTPIWAVVNICFLPLNEILPFQQWQKEKIWSSILLQNRYFGTSTSLPACYLKDQATIFRHAFTVIYEFRCNLFPLSDNSVIYRKSFPLSWVVCGRTSPQHWQCSLHFQLQCRNLTDQRSP